MMKGIYFLFIVGIILTGVRVSAQKTDMESVRVTKAEAVRENSFLKVDFTLDCRELDINRNEELKLQPVVITRGGDTLRMPYLLLPGKVRGKINDRKARLYGEEISDLPYRTVYLTPGTGAIVNYTESIPFDERMYGAQVVLLEEIVGCADCRKELAVVPLVTVPNPLRVAFIMPEPVTEEKQWVSVYVYFPWDQASILPAFRGNAAELEKIDRLMGVITEHPNVRLDQIYLKGYASPEGAYSYNTRLAARRASAVNDYIRTKYRPDDSLIKVESEPEDWKGLRAQVDSSELTYRPQILAIIDRISEPDARDRKIRNLDGNRTYNYLLKNFYPVLRRVDCGIRYTIEEPYTLAEIEQWVNDDPQKLTLNELFLVAAAKQPGSDDFNRIFVIAARLYPEDEIVNANRAAIALQTNDLEMARQCLGHDNHYAEAWNNLGVLLLREGRIPEAVSCFEDAKACGCEEAAYNLRQLIAENMK